MPEKLQALFILLVLLNLGFAIVNILIKYYTKDIFL